MDNRTKNATRNIVWGIFSKIVTILFPFVVRTVMIYTLGMRYVGLGSLFTSVLSVMSFAELGIGSALVFSMYKPMADNDIDKVCALLKFYRNAYYVIGTVIMAIGMVVLPFIDKLIAADVPEGINIKLLFGAYVLNNVIGYYLFAYKQSLFNASQRVDRISIVNTSTQIITNILQIIALVVFSDYYMYVFIIPLITCLNNIIICCMAHKYFPQYKCKGKLEKKELYEIKKKIGGMVFQKIGGIVLTSVDTIVISAFLGLIPLGLYQNYYYIITSLFGILSVIMVGIIPVVGNCVAVDSIEKNYRDFSKFNFIYVWIVAWCSVCFLCICQPFMKIWVGEDRMFGESMVVLFTLYFFVHKWCDMLYVYQEATGIWWETKFIPLISALINLVVNIILVKIIGLPGILISTIVAIIFIYDLGYAKALFGTYFKQAGSIKHYWLKQLSFLLITSIACIVSKTLCELLIMETTILQLIINCIICLIVPNIIFIIFWKRISEYKEAKLLVQGVINKRIKNVK